MKKRILLLSFIALSSIPAFAQNVPSYVPSNGLVGWWPFNGNANDESGNGNNGTVNGATLTNDRFGNANQAFNFSTLSAVFGQAANYISIPYNSTFNGPSLTLSAWINPVSYYWDGNAIHHSSILYRGGEFCSFNGIQEHFRFFISEGGAISSLINDGNYLSTPNILSLNQWQYLTLTFNQGTMMQYINGTLIATDSNQLSTNLNNCYGISIGDASMPNGHWYYFNGDIDDIGIWNRALTECEIQDLYHTQFNSASMSISAGLDQSICAGDNVTLNGTGGSNYQWNNNVVDGQAFAPAQSNAYVVTAQDTLGCTGTDTVVVTVLENATNTLTETALDSYTLNGQTYTQSGTYTQTLTGANGCDSTITLNLTLNFTGMDELGAGVKKLLKITDLNGKIIPRRKNTLMLFIYEDGTVERVVEMEE